MRYGERLVVFRPRRLSAPLSAAFLGADPRTGPPAILGHGPGGTVLDFKD
jgi:hypothetical protein